MSWLGAALGLVNWLLGLFKPKTPDPVAVAKDDGAANQALAEDAQGEAVVADARAASDASARASAVDPGGLRDPDPDSRD